MAAGNLTSTLHACSVWQVLYPLRHLSMSPCFSLIPGTEPLPRHTYTLLLSCLLSYFFSYCLICAPCFQQVTSFLISTEKTCKTKGEDSHCSSTKSPHLPLSPGHPVSPLSLLCGQQGCDSLNPTSPLSSCDGPSSPMSPTFLCWVLSLSHGHTEGVSVLQTIS